MHQLLSLGAVNSLPEDLQWAIRMLLPRREDAAAPAQEAAGSPADTMSQIVPPTAYLPYMLQPQQLAVLTQHAQQVTGPSRHHRTSLDRTVHSVLFIPAACSAESAVDSTMSPLQFWASA